MNSDKEVTQSWSPAEALDLWKYFGGVAGADKSTMITTASWLLAFSGALVGYFFVTFIGLGVITQPIKALCVASLGFVISLLSAYISLLYGGYASRNWAKADAIAREQESRDRKWNALLPNDNIVEERTSRTFRFAVRFSRPSDHTKELAPVFSVFAWLGISGALVHALLILWSATCL